MQLAASQASSSSVDADVAAESAALQFRCRQWIRSQDTLQQPAKQPQGIQGSSQQPQGMHSPVNHCLTLLKNLCLKACHKQGVVKVPQGSAAVLCQSGSLDVGVPAAIHDNETALNAQHSANRWSHAGADLTSADAVATEGVKEDAGHLKTLTADLAATEKLSKAGTSVSQTDITEMRNTCTSVEVDPTSNDR